MNKDEKNPNYSKKSCENFLPGGTLNRWSFDFRSIFFFFWGGAQHLAYPTFLCLAIAQGGGCFTPPISMYQPSQKADPVQFWVSAKAKICRSFQCRVATKQRVIFPSQQMPNVDNYLYQTASAKMQSFSEVNMAWTLAPRSQKGEISPREGF